MPRSCFPILMMIALGTLTAEGLGQGPSLPQLPQPPNFDPSKIDPMKLLQSGDPIKALEGLLGAEGKEVGKAIRGVSAYPKETRAGILQLATFTTQYPNLIKDLAEVRKKPDAEIDRYLTGNNYPNDLQQAAAIVLVDAPDTLDHMLEHPAMVGVIGKAYSIPPGRQAIEMILERAAAQNEQIRKTAADSWANKLQQKPEVMNQYVQMLEQYTKSKHGADAQQDPTWQSYNYGVTKSANGYSVSDVPSAEVINYALANGYQWAAVVAAIIQQYLYNQNTQEYQDAVGGWYSNYGNNIPSDARTSQDNYYDMLQELANYASAYASQYGDESYGSGSGYSDSGSGYGSSDEETAAAAAAGGAAGAAGATAAGEYIDRQRAKDVAKDGYQNAGQYLANNAGNYPALSNWLNSNGVDLASAANAANAAGTAGNVANAGRAPGAGSPFSDRKNHPPGADRKNSPAQPGSGGPFGGPGQSPFGNAPPFAGGQPPFSPPAGLTPPSGGPFGGASPFGGTPGSASPFSDRSKSTPISDRARPSSPMGQGQGNPFAALAGGGMPQFPGGGLPQMSGGPAQIMRGMPNRGQQLSRAQGQMASAWKPGGMPSINGGMPRMGGGMPMGGPGGGPRMGGPGGGGPRPGGPGGGGPRPGPGPFGS